jgi:hypothetical protein
MADRTDYWPDYTEDIIEFLQRTGGLRLAIEICWGGQSFTELESATPHSTSTITKRLKEGGELKLWQKIAPSSPGRRGRQKYVPTSRGLELFSMMSDINLVGVYYRKRTWDDEFEQRVDAFYEQLEEAVEEGAFPHPSIEYPTPSAEAFESIDALEQLGIDRPTRDDDADEWPPDDAGEGSKDVTPRVERDDSGSSVDPADAFTEADLVDPDDIGDDGEEEESDDEVGVDDPEDYDDVETWGEEDGSNNEGTN